MRKQFFMFILLGILCISKLTAQDMAAGDFVVIDEIAENGNTLEAQYSGEENALFLMGNAPLAIEQITNAIQGKTIRNLHIYVPTKPGAIVFSSIAIIPDRVNRFSESLSSWKNSISGNVVVHSNVAFDGVEGQQLHSALENITGLLFIMD